MRTKTHNVRYEQDASSHMLTNCLAFHSGKDYPAIITPSQ